ncbi:uncharacterized protein LOC117592930 [Esox lucius]|uniref:uncharacterized protein LOC117592930 n=1 Tax=Esox lucius TaxID=8010 RepID=UPI001476C2EA|nr:uncharacterized protein LOC117592930 [Esox lucius]
MHPQPVVFGFLLCFLTDHRDPPQPRLIVSHTVVTERDSVQLICETPSSVSVLQCIFFEYERPILSDTSCKQTVTGTQLLSWAGQKSPAVVQVKCYYILESNHVSPSSNQGFVTVQDFIPSSTLIPKTPLRATTGSTTSLTPTATTSDHRNLPQPSLRVNPTVIRERDSVQLSCETPPSVSVSRCIFYNEARLDLPDTSCKQTVTGTQLLSLAGLKSPAVVQVMCYYNVETYPSSSFSNTVIVTVQDFIPSSTLIPKTPLRATTGSTTSLTPTANTSVNILWLAAVGAVSGVGGFLVGLTAVCLCMKTKRNTFQRPQAQQNDHNQQFVMGTNRSGSLVDSGNEGLCSLIPSDASTFMPSCPVGENGESSEYVNPDTYHVYSSIPYRPAVPAQTNYIRGFL